MTCIGEPISWLRLERHALAADPEIAHHLAACGACRACMAEITGDAIALPALPVRAAAEPRRRWWLVAIPALAAAAIALLIVLPREAERRDEVALVKGVGEVVLGTVRERAGVVRPDARTFLPGDRWKVVVTCPPAARTMVDVAVVEDGGATAAYPLAPIEIACGNRVVVPGAFTLTGTRAQRICIRIGAEARTLPRPGDEGVACVAVAPE
jgi:hypothetical protein